MHIEPFFDKKTATFTYVVSDKLTKRCAIIDSVLDYTPETGQTTTCSADKVIAYIKKEQLIVEWILETHLHADHLTAANYLKKQFDCKTGIGYKITEALNYWVPLFNTTSDTPINGSQFSHLFQDGEQFSIGSLSVKVLFTPGHTPVCVSYLIEDAIFVGDTLFMPYIGTARTDFPGGSALTLYDSIQKILSLPDNTRIFTCHDYPPEGRTFACESTVGEQKNNKILVNHHITKKEYVALRNQRDKDKPVPRLLLPSIQVNLRAGSFGEPEVNGTCYVKIPVS